MYSYVAFALGIRSEFPLPELLSLAAAPDVFIRRGVVPFPSEPLENGVQYLTAREGRFFWKAGRFCVREGRKIIFQPTGDHSIESIRSSLLGPIMALLLHQRGCLILHASAVSINGKAAAFLGESGQGKSTLAAACYLRGHGLVADDVLAIAPDESSPRVLPGFPQLRLCQSTVDAMEGIPRDLPLPYPNSPKRVWRTSRRFHHEPQALSRCYLLAEGPVPKIHRLTAQEALPALIRHSYAAEALHRLHRRRYFFQCSRLAKERILFRLERPRSWSGIWDLVKLVEEDLACAS